MLSLQLSSKHFPANGRALTDDVFDSFLQVLTNGKVRKDPHWT